MGTDELGTAAEIAGRFLDNIETVVHGKRDQITLVAAALICGGHALLEDVPGTAKTVLARAIAQSIQGAVSPAHPVHARPAADRRHRPLDLQPARARLRVPRRAGVRERRARRRDQPRDAEDPVGAARGDGRAAGDGRRRPRGARRTRSSSSRRRTRSSTRARSRSPRRSSTASSCGRRSAIPDADDEVRIVDEQLGRTRSTRLRPVVGLEDVARSAPRSRPCSSTRRWRAGSSTSSARPGRLDIVAIGSSVRGTLALNRASRAWAVLHGRRFVTPDDVERLFVPVLMHRLLFRPSFLAEIRDHGWEATALEVRRALPRAGAEAGPRHRPRRPGSAGGGLARRWPREPSRSSRDGG